MVRLDKRAFGNAFVIKMQGIFGDFGFTREVEGERINVSSALSP